VSLYRFNANSCAKVLSFFFPTETTRWLAILRIGLGVQIVAYTLSLRKDWIYLFGGNSNGLISRDLAEAVLSAESHLSPRLGWLVATGHHFGIAEQTTLYLVWLCLFCSGCLLTIGLFCRPAAFIAWLLQLCAAKSGTFFSYGADNFTTIGLFYLMLAPLPDTYSIDWRLWHYQARDPHLLGFFRRALQLHLCLIYFFGGLTKAFGTGWWNGESVWRALIRPPFNIVPPEILISWRSFFPVLGISICILEVGYAFFIWSKRTRLFWLPAIIGMHVAIGLLMGLYLFALIMIVLNLAAFGPSFAFRCSALVSLKLAAARVGRAQ
jgi:hypothetical protein